MTSIHILYNTDTSNLIASVLETLHKPSDGITKFIVVEVRGDNQLALSDEIASRLSHFPDTTQIIIAADIPYSLKFDKSVYLDQISEILCRNHSSQVRIPSPIFIATPTSRIRVESTLQNEPLTREKLVLLKKKKKKAPFSFTRSSEDTFGFSGLSFCDHRNPISSTLPMKPSQSDLNTFVTTLETEAPLDFVSVKFANEVYIRYLPYSLTALDASALSFLNFDMLRPFRNLKWLNIGANLIKHFDPSELPDTLEQLMLHKSNFTSLENLILFGPRKLGKLSVYRTLTSKLPTKEGSLYLRSLNVGATQISSKELSRVPYLFPNLESLNISNLALNRVPSALNDLTQLTELNVAKNKIPSEDLCALQVRNPQLKLIF